MKRSPQIMGGHADLTIDGGIFANFVKDGRVKLITVLSDTRGPYAPDVKTIVEQGGKIPFSNYRVFIAPKGFPADAKAALVAALDKAINSPEVIEYHAKLYNPVKNLGPRRHGEGCRRSGGDLEGLLRQQEIRA